MRIKLLIFLIILIFSATSILTQTIIWEEYFEVNNRSWVLDSNWSITEGALCFTCSPVIAPYDLSATSSIIYLPQNVDDLVVTQYIDEYSANSGEMANIEIIHSGIIDTLWSYALNGEDWGILGGENISFSLSPYAGHPIKLRFRSYGASTYNINN